MTKPPAHDKSTAEIERPAKAAPAQALYGSDAIAETIRDLDVPYIALNPGASYRGLHDSLVNYLGNVRPQLLVCLHEEHAVAIAHGYAKVTGRAMAAAVHSNVGLFHASMAVFNAWCDRMPLLLIGATGDMDAARRRPWIEWIHTARDQGAIVRNYTKWDDQPTSPLAARESLLRAMWLSETAPQAPVYVNLDLGLQEQLLEAPLPPITADRFRPPVSASASAAQVNELAGLLDGAERPLILAGRGSRSEEAWARRVALAEGLGAQVITDLKIGAAFPTDHPLHPGAPGIYVDAEGLQAVRGADLILSLDWVDLAGLQRAAFGEQRPHATIVQVSQDYNLHNGWSMDYQGLPVVDMFLAADPDEVVAATLQALGFQQNHAGSVSSAFGAAGADVDAGVDAEAGADVNANTNTRAGAGASVAVGADPGGDSDTQTGQASGPGGLLSMAQVAAALRRAAGQRPVTLTHLPLGWDGAHWPFRHPLDFIGSDGGGGIGGGPGISVGAALALKGTGRLAVCIGGDGDFLMGATAIWTAVHYRIPLLYIVANNQSFFNDEVHQERVARMRGRPVENKWIGQRMQDPEVGIVGMAIAQGAAGFGPVSDAEGLETACREAVAVVEGGGVAVIDARIESGYTPAMASALKNDKETSR